MDINQAIVDYLLNLGVEIRASSYDHHVFVITNVVRNHKIRLIFRDGNMYLTGYYEDYVFPLSDPTSLDLLVECVRKWGTLVGEDSHWSDDEPT